MSKNLKNSINDIFGGKPSANQKAWKIINQFYHLVITKMEEDNISRADLARNLGKSRAAISQMFNKSPNISIKKMIEIADAINLEINLTSDLFLEEKQTNEIKKFVFIPIGSYERESITKDSKSRNLKRSSRSSYELKCSGF